MSIYFVYLDFLLSIEPKHFAENIDAAALTDVDAEVTAIQRSHTDAEIVADLLVGYLYTDKDKTRFSLALFLILP